MVQLVRWYRQLLAYILVLPSPCDLNRYASCIASTALSFYPKARQLNPILNIESPLKIVDPSNLSLDKPLDETSSMA